MAKPLHAPGGVMEGGQFIGKQSVLHAVIRKLLGAEPHSGQGRAMGRFTGAGGSVVNVSLPNRRPRIDDRVRDPHTGHLGTVQTVHPDGTGRVAWDAGHVEVRKLDELAHPGGQRNLPDPSRTFDLPQGAPPVKAEKTAPGRPRTAAEKLADTLASGRVPSDTRAEVMDRLRAAPSGGWMASQERRRADLRRLAAQGGDSKRLPGGHNADVQLVTTADGSQYVHKGKVGNRGSGVADDAEELGALVAQAAGARSPAVVRAPDGSLYEEYIPGRTGYSFTGTDSLTVPKNILDSEQGRRQGLADVIMGISDRSNPGNWLMGGNGDLVGIDHGTAFLNADAPRGNPFAGYLVDRNGHYKPNDLSQSELAAVRDRMEQLRPEFERLGRGDWWRQSMDRLAEIERHAAPAKPRSPAVRKMAAAKAPKESPEAIRAKLDAATTREERYVILQGRTVAELKQISPVSAGVAKGKADLVDRIVMLHSGRTSFEHLGRYGTPGAAIEPSPDVAPVAPAPRKAAQKLAAPKAPFDLGAVSTRLATARDEASVSAALERLNVTQLRQVAKEHGLISYLPARGASADELRQAMVGPFLRNRDRWDWR